MNITKVLAEEVANKMVEPLEKKINLLHDEQVRITEEVIRKSIPQEITDCFQKFRSYFSVAYSITLFNGSYEKRVAGLKKEGETDQNVFAEYKAKFVDAISNDLNTSMAITVLYDLLKADTNDITKYELIKDFDKVLSLNLENAKSTETTEGVDAELESFVLAKIEERKEAKKAKDFAKADAIRDELLAKGIVIKDTREGVVWHKAE